MLQQQLFPLMLEISNEITPLLYVGDLKHPLCPTQKKHLKANNRQGVSVIEMTKTLGLQPEISSSD